MAISVADYLMGRDLSFANELTDELRANAAEIVEKANKLLDAFGERRHVTSGWRPAVINAKTPGASKNSLHISCLAVDLEDHDGRLDAWCVDNKKTLRDIGLWLESPSSTKGWTHVQCRAPRSGHLIFQP